MTADCNKRPEHAGLIAWFALLLLLKLLLVSGNESVSEGSDSVEYMLLAKAWFWEYVQSPIRGPVYPLFVATTSALHLPLRVTSEVCFAGSAAWFSYSLVRTKLPRVSALGIYIILLYHPLTILNLDMPMSEGLFVTLLLVSLASFVSILTTAVRRSRLILGFIYGLSCALMIHTRESDKALVFTMMAVMLSALYISSALQQKAFFVRPPAEVAAVSTASLWIINLVIFSLNFTFFGNFGYNKVADSSMLNLVHTLMSINVGEHPAHSRILVSTSARKLAYGVSPTLKVHASDIENSYLQNKEQSAYGTFARTGLKGELDTEDTLALHNVICKQFRLENQIAPQALQNSARRQCDARLDAISNEINDALDTGRISRRFVLFIFNPALDLLLPEVKKSFSRIIRSFTGYANEPIQEFYPFYGTLFSPLYDLMARRDGRLLRKGPLQAYLAIRQGLDVTGIAFRNDAINFLRTTGGDPRPLGFPIDMMAREELAVYEDLGKADKIQPLDVALVPDLLRQQSGVGVVFYKFTVPAVADRIYLHFTELSIDLKNGGTLVVKNPDLGVVRHAEPKPVNGSGLSLLVTSFDLDLKPWQTTGYRIQKVLFKAYNKYAHAAMILLLGVTGAGWLAARFIRHPKDPTRKSTAEWLILSVVASTVLIRIIFYTIVDATVFPINMERHLFAASVLLFPALIIMASLAWHAVLGRRVW